MEQNKYFGKIITLILIGMIAPPVIFWVSFMRTPSITPEKARQILTASKQDAVLIDVRSESEFQKISLKEAVNIPWDAISSESQQSWGEMLKNKKHIFIICRLGALSALATDKLHQLGYPHALNVQGGMDSWLDGGKRTRDIEIMRVKTPHGETDAVPRFQSTLFEQAVICVAAFFLKPLYEIISLVLVIMLWKSREPDIAALRRSMIAFFMGENACAVNFLFFNEQSNLLEFLHTYGMLVCFGFASYALLKTIDIRIIKFSQKKDRCALLPLCKQCYKYQDVSCNLRVLSLFAILAGIVVAFMPLTAELESYYYVTKVFGDDVIFGHSMIQEIFEVRLYPLAALFFFVLSFLILYFRKEMGIETSKVLFAIGLGPLSFSLMRFLCFWGYSGNPLWAEAWEEITEFLFIGFVFCIILQVRKVIYRG